MYSFDAYDDASDDDDTGPKESVTAPTEQSPAKRAQTVSDDIIERVISTHEKQIEKRMADDAERKKKELEAAAKAQAERERQAAERETAAAQEQEQQHKDEADAERRKRDQPPPIIDEDKLGIPKEILSDLKKRAKGDMSVRGRAKKQVHAGQSSWRSDSDKGRWKSNDEMKHRQSFDS